LAGFFRASRKQDAFSFERSHMHYGLIGEHLGHSFSKPIHEALGNPDYVLKEIPKAEIEDFLNQKDFLGLNVTIPYKQTVLPHCQWLDPYAKACQAVNCIVNDNGTLKGWNTDCMGIEDTLKHAGFDPAGKKVLILGYGGAAKACHAVIELLYGIPVHAVRKQMEGACLLKDAAAVHPDAACIINATPVGMIPDEHAPLSLEGFDHLEFVFDLVYNPLRTPLLQDAARRGIPYANGLRMLVSQAAHASRHFLGQMADEQQIEEILRDLETSKTNIVLIGMSSCGKTTLGKRLAEMLERPFADLDEEIVKAAGTSIPELFQEGGEALFRDWETNICKQFSKKSGWVLACGGGIITREENMEALQSNGTIYWLQRDVSQLVEEDASRPMLVQGLKSLYEKRLPLYQFWGIPIANNGTEEEGLQALLNAWNGKDNAL
jgi:shikimate dehydrogenase